MIKFKLLAAALSLCAILPVSSAQAQQSLPQLSGEPGRVIILDASGSMRNPSFINPRRERMEIGREFLNETYDELSGQNDSTKTSLIVFGADQRLTWDSVSSRHGGSPSNYPASGPLCRDSKIGLPYAQLSNSSVDSARAVGRGTQWGGMTLIQVSINQALASFDPTIGGRIILISDMTDVNCLPAGASTICEAIAPSLREIRRQGMCPPLSSKHPPRLRVPHCLNACGRQPMPPPQMIQTSTTSLNAPSAQLHSHRA